MDNIPLSGLWSAIATILNSNFQKLFNRQHLSIGWANYINGDLTPISIPQNVETKLTMDLTNGTIINSFLPEGVESLWDNENSQFDFTSLNVGDMVDIRVDGFLTTTTINDSFQLNFVGALGSPSEYTLPFSSGNRFSPGSNLASRYNGIFIGSEDMVNFPSEIRGLASDDANGYLVDIYIKVIKLESD